jgi:hypothetical protein
LFIVVYIFALLPDQPYTTDAAAQHCFQLVTTLLKASSTSIRCQQQQQDAN